MPVFNANTRAFCLYGITKVRQITQIVFCDSSLCMYFVFIRQCTRLMQFVFTSPLDNTHILLTLCLLQLPDR